MCFLFSKNYLKMYNPKKKGNTCNNKVFKEDYMKKDIHLKNIGEKNINDKIISYVVVGAIIIAIIVISLLLYSQKINQDVKDETMTLDQMTDMMGDTNEYNEETESASTEIGKTVEESEEEAKQETVENTTTQNTSINEIAESSINTNTNTDTETIQNTTSEDTEKTQEVKELTFQKPVEGEIVREFAQDNLVYSETLEEWVTHNGIDIKADKTTVVKSAEAGVVKSIKNDPRYGLTIVIEHDDTYQTVYSNLLTSEFVVEGEKVEKGQSIGTVGNSAVFEIADEPHLHFEILKNSMQVDPSIYIQ